MDQVRNALKCVNCREILATPVTLPCGHTICQSHTQVTDEQIICAKCGSRHPNKEFRVNEAFADLINAQLCMLDFGKKHRETSKSCNDLKSLIDKNNAMVNDLEYFIHESTSELKNEVMLKSEQLKVRIDEITQEIIDDLDLYERRCKINCENKDITYKFAALLSDFKKQNEEAEKKLNDWSNVLNQLKFDPDKWIKIKVDCDKELKNLCEKRLLFEKEVFLNELGEKQSEVESFKKAKFDFKVKSEMSLQSLILDSKLTEQFFELCNFKNGVQDFELLYRGSRDGFKAADFHSKCDNQPNTVTIIESTKGFIFGGYTQLSWSSKFSYSSDPNAFLFSLINKFKKPFLSKIESDPSEAIFSSESSGPVFGGYDIHISDCSNSSLANFAHFRTYKKPDHINDPMNLYFCDSYNFQVKEIEVFKIK